MSIPLSSNIEPRNGNTWPLVEDKYVRGGYRPIESLAALADLDVEHKKPGMMFFVLAEKAVYALGPDLEPNLYTGRPRLRIAVIGDSLNSPVSGVVTTASHHLAFLLESSGVSSVGVVNAARGGSTFAKCDSADFFQFGSMTQVEFACASDPDVIVFVLGLNDIQAAVDAGGTLNTTTVASLVSDGVAAVNKAKALCPSAHLFICREQAWDPDIPYWSGNTQNGVRNHSVLPFWWELPTEVSPETASGFLSSRGISLTRGLIKLYQDLQTALAQSGTHCHHTVIPYFKIARLGGLCSDLLHPTASGTYLMGTCLFDMLIAAEKLGPTGLPIQGDYLIPDVNRRDLGNSFNQVFGLVFPGQPDSATGARTEVYTDFDRLAQSGLELYPHMWFAPARMRVSTTGSGGNTEPVTITVSGAAPRQLVEFSVDGANWLPMGEADFGGFASIQLDDRGMRTGQHECRVRCGPNFSGQPKTITGPIPFTLATTRTTRIAVIGDSMSYGHTDSLPAWPAVLEEKLNGLGSNVKIINCSLNGATFSSALGVAGSPTDEEFQFGDLSAVDYAIAFNPDIVICKLGANDSARFVTQEGVIFESEKTRVYVAITGTFSKLRAQLPNARLIFASQNIADTDVWNVETAKNKHVGCSLLHSVRVGNGVLDNVRSAEVLDDLATAYARRRVQEISVMRTFIQTIPYVTTYAIDYFKASRMGGLGPDMVHMNAGGHQILAAMHFQELMNFSELPNAPQWVWNASNDVDHLLNSGIQRSGDGYVERLSGRFNFVNMAFPGLPLDPYYWWSALKPSITVTETVNTQQDVLIQATCLTPLSLVYATVGNDPTLVVLGSTNSKGDILARIRPAALGIGIGTNWIRLRVRHPYWDDPEAKDHVFGPYQVVYSS